MKNSLKQLLRTPMKTALFFLLMAAATALLVLGANLWAHTAATRRSFATCFPKTQ